MKYRVSLLTMLLLSCSPADGVEPGERADASAQDVGGSPGADAEADAPSDTAFDATPDASLDVDAGPADVSVRIVDGELFVGGEPFFIQGVGWNPVPAGGTQANDLDFAGYVDQDSELMAQAGLNVVRTYSAITDRAVLDTLHARGIYVLNTVYAFGGAPAESVRADVSAVADHPAILMWLIGNEWNYNGLYDGLSHEDSLLRLNEVAAIIREVDGSHPIATVYGEVPSVETIEAMPLVDVWGLNVYRGIGFGDLFDVWEGRSDKPMFLAEFGADAWNANVAAEDQASQAEATVTLIAGLGANRVSAGGPCLGGALFEWADEWWKDGSGSPAEHDVGGVAPGGGPHPDGTFNEEWWGLVEVDRTPRQAYRDLPSEW